MAMEQSKCKKKNCSWLLSRRISRTELTIDDPSTTVKMGFCYGKSDTAYSQRRMDTCTGNFSKRECVTLTDDDSAARCVWENLSDQSELAAVADHDVG